jgi:hypothetical protein
MKVGKSGGKRPVEESSHKLQDNIEMDVREIE